MFHVKEGESRNEKNREKRRCKHVDIGPVGGSATPTLYKSLFLLATCSVFQFERRAACDYLQESSSLSSSCKGDRILCPIERTSSLRCCGGSPLLSSPWYVFLDFFFFFLHRLARFSRDFRKPTNF